MNLLVLRYRFIGDTILTVPFLRNLRKAHPDAIIDMIVAPYSSDVIKGIPYLNNLIFYDPPTIHSDSHGQHRTIGSKLQFIRSLRFKKYDKAYVLKRSFSSALIAYLSGAKQRIGFDTEKRGYLLTKRVPYRHDRHEVLNFLSLLEADSVGVEDHYLEVWLSDDEITWATDFLIREGIFEEQFIIGIHPFTANPKRAWHPENFMEIATALQKSYEARIMIFGGQKDIIASRYFQKNMNPPPIMVVGNTDLRQTMAILNRCSLLICNDSGIMHLGAALRVPLIALFGPQSPVKFGPWGDNCIIVYKQFPCSPCKQKFFIECKPSERGSPLCMEEISVEEILDKARFLIK